jgi:hypothetical protein
MSITVTITGVHWDEIVRQAEALIRAQPPSPGLAEFLAKQRVADAEASKTEPPPPVEKPQPRKARAEKPAPEPAAEEPAAPEPVAEKPAEEPEAARLDYAQIAELALRVFREKGRDVLTAIWAEFEVATGQELDPSQYGDAHARLTEALYG